jgi:hypothetical protein
MKRINRRMALLLLALAGSAALVLFGSPAPNLEVVQPSLVAATPSPTAPASQPPAQSASVLTLKPREASPDIVQAFPSRDWAPPPLPPLPPLPLAVLTLKPREASPDIVQAFPSRDWAPPPLPPLPPLPPPKPTAPPLPFVMLGEKWEDGQWQVFLGRNDETFVVRAGDTLDGRYRVDSIAPPTMTFTYLPLKERQTLTIGNME